MSDGNAIAAFETSIAMFETSVTMFEISIANDAVL